MNRSNVALMQIPACPPSDLIPNPLLELASITLLEQQQQMVAEFTGNNNNNENNISSKSAAATETMRKRLGPPLFNVAYRLEARIGTNSKLLLSIPIVIGSIPLSKEDNSPLPTGMKPFGAGPQNIKEPDDDGKIHLRPMEFSPVYPVFE